MINETPLFDLILARKIKYLVSFLVADLSDCQLMQVPDAVYFMMKDTNLVACDLSSNLITKIPPKFPVKFSLITGAQPGSIISIFVY